uniref:Beta-Casp domain-containing protein n=1 Tax=Oryza meridionalis TaxID=40149 RepID=A0A0E0CXU6_9ORYZ
MGSLMMRELVGMHREFVRCYGPDRDQSPVWMEGEKLKKLMSVLQKITTEDEGNNNLAALVPLYRDDGMDEDESIKFLCSNDDIAEEIERINFICSCITDAINSGGSVLIPIGRLGIILLLLEHMSETLHSSNMKSQVPIFMISDTAEEIITFTNALPEWLCKSRQEKLFSCEPLFGHVELLKEGKLSLFPHLYSKGLLHGPAVHLLHRWRADKRCLLVLEQGVDAELTLKPFMPLAIQVLGCSFLSGIKVGKIDPLMGLLKPKLILFPEGQKSLCPATDKLPWSFLYYSKGKTIEVPNMREEFEVRMTTEVAFGLQPRQLDKTTAVARLKAKLLLSNGQYVLAAAKSELDQSERHLLHRGTVDASRIPSALQEKGIVCSFSAHADYSAPSDRERVISVTSPGEALVKVTSERTTIYCDDEETAERVYDALRSICNGI